MKLKAKLYGDRELGETLAHLGKRQIKSITRRSVKAAGKVILSRAKGLVPYNQKRKQGEHLRDVLIDKVKSYHKNGVVVSVIGPASRRAPHKHLVERGSMPKRPAVKNTPGAARYVSLGGRIVRITHTGQMPAFHFMELAGLRGGGEARRKMVSMFRDSLQRATRKAIRMGGKPKSK